MPRSEVEAFKWWKFAADQVMEQVHYAKMRRNAARALETGHGTCAVCAVTAYAFTEKRSLRRVGCSGGWVMYGSFAMISPC